MYLNGTLRRGMKLRYRTGFPDKEIILKTVVIAMHRQ